MHIAHFAIWAKDLERLKSFYERYFGAKTNNKYTNAQKQFQSYFLTFASGAQLELMFRQTFFLRKHHMDQIVLAMRIWPCQWDQSQLSMP